MNVHVFEHASQWKPCFHLFSVSCEREIRRGASRTQLVVAFDIVGARAELDSPRHLVESGWDDGEQRERRVRRVS